MRSLQKIEANVDMQLQMDQITKRLIEGCERLLSAEAADGAAKLNGESRPS